MVCLVSIWYVLKDRLFHRQIIFTLFFVFERRRHHNLLKVTTPTFSCHNTTSHDMETHGGQLKSY